MKKMFGLILLALFFISCTETSAKEFLNEDVSKRTLNSKTYKNNDGTYTSKFWELPVHYKDQYGQILEIDNTITPSNDPNFDYMNLTNTTKTWFKNDIFGENPNLKLQKGNATVEIFSIKDIELKKLNNQDQEYIAVKKNKKELEPENYFEKNKKLGVRQTDIRGKLNKFKYDNVFEEQNLETDITYSVLDHKLQEEVYINEFVGFPEISQKIKLTNAFAIKRDDIIQIFNVFTHELLWTLPKPYMHEVINKENINYGIHYDLECEDNVEISSCTNLVITKRFTKEGKDWLKDKDRQYPVIIDPDYVGNSADGHIRGCWGCTFAQARATSQSFDITTNYNRLGILYYSSGNDIYLYRGYLKFDTSGIDDSATITQVNLTLTANADRSDSKDFDVQIAKYNWGSYDPIASGNRETNFDSCLSATADDSIWRNTNGMSLDTPYTSGNLSTSWPSKTGNTYYCLRSSSDYDNISPTGHESMYWYSADESTTAYKPTLTVTYTLAPTNDSLTFTNPDGESGNSATNDGSTEWNFRAVITDTDGYEDIETVVLRLANSSDSSTPFDSLKYTWTQATDSFAETADTQDAASIASDSDDSDCSGNTCTLDFKIVFDSDFATVATEYDAELLTTDDNSVTDEDSYTDFYQVTNSEDINLTFTIEEVGINTVTNGITTNVASTFSSLPFSNMGVNEVKYAAHKLTVTTNADSGYEVNMKLLNFLQGNNPDNNIDPYAADNVSWSTPQAWTSPTGTVKNVNTAWIGANTSDTRIDGWSDAASKFGPVSTVAYNVMKATAADTGTEIYVTYAIEANVNQPQDLYSGTIVYDVLPTY